MRAQGSPAGLEARRRQAVALLVQGRGVRDVARQIGCSPASVSRWQAALGAGGPDPLWAKPPAGRPPRLTARQKDRLLTFLVKGATAHVWPILRGCGWSCQKPERRARERDEAAIRRWRAERWRQIRKRPARRP